MAMKSVPPLVAPAFRHRLMANALIMPPNTQTKRVSCVTVYPGRISVRTEDKIIIRQEYRVNFFQINLKLINTGTALSSRFIRV